MYALAIKVDNKPGHLRITIPTIVKKQWLIINKKMLRAQKS